MVTLRVRQAGKKYASSSDVSGSESESPESKVSERVSVKTRRQKTNGYELPSQRRITASSEGRLFVVKGIPRSRQPNNSKSNERNRDSRANEDERNDDSKTATRKRQRLSWAAKTAGSPRRSRRSSQLAPYQQGSGSDETSVKRQKMSPNIVEEDEEAVSIMSASASRNGIAGSQPQKSLESPELFYDAVSDQKGHAPGNRTHLLPSLVNDFDERPHTPDSPRALSPPTSPDTLTSDMLPPPFIQFPIPIPQTFPDRAAKIVATIFAPISQPKRFIGPLTSYPLASRSTETLYELALNTQKALQAWQEEYIQLDKRTAPVAGPFPKKPATGGRLPIEVARWEEEKERELFAEGGLLASLRVGLPTRSNRASTPGAPTGKVTEGRELRRRRADVSVIDNLGISEDDAGAVSGREKRPRKPVRRFEIGDNGRESSRSGIGGRRSRGDGAADAIVAGTRGGYQSEAGEKAGGEEKQPQPIKRGRWGYLQKNQSRAESVPMPLASALSSPFTINAPAAAAAAAASVYNNNTKATPMVQQRKKNAASTSSPVPPKDKGPPKPRQRSEKRSHSMTIWWAERKRKAAEQKAKEARERGDFGGGVESIMDFGIGRRDMSRMG